MESMLDDELKQSFHDTIEGYCESLRGLNSTMEDMIAIETEHLERMEQLHIKPNEKTPLRDKIFGVFMAVIVLGACILFCFAEWIIIHYPSK